MNYQETLEYMFNCLPAYHLIGKSAYKADLSNTEVMMEHLGHPETKFRSVHVAGTNGKGSVSHFLASVMGQVEQEGRKLKVGLYTSPHLLDFRERIRINGEMIPEEEVVRFIAENKSFFESHELSFFEMTVGLAFQYFAQQQVDIAIVEVGLGGRLDATNVISPLLSVITNISFDHTQFLGNTLPLIAGEKAGIIKPHTPVVIGQTQPETKPVFEAKASEIKAPIFFADQTYKIVETSDSTPVMMRFDVERLGEKVLSGLQSPMAGAYQLKNLATLMMALEQLRALGFAITDENIRWGIERAVADTGLHGRWECFGTNPLLICETAHNEDGVHAMLAKLKELSYRELHIVYGCVNDKDFRHILQLIGTIGGDRPIHYYYTQPSVPRRLEVETLSTAASELGMGGHAFAEVGQAIQCAKANATAEDMILVTGSIFLIADAVSYFRSVQPCAETE